MVDTVSLFTPPAGPAPFAQGVLLTFNSLTGANTVNVNGAIFTNLPLLNVPDVVNMQVGSVVMLAQLGGSYAIMGRVVVPSSALLNTSAVGTLINGNSVAVSTITTTPTSKVSVGLLIPPWANVLTFLTTGDICAKNSTGTIDFLNVFIQYSGSFGTGNSGSGDVQVPAGTTGGCSVSATNFVAVTPGETLSFNLAASSSGSTWTSTGTLANLNVYALCQRV